MSNELADRLELPPMVQRNTSPLQTGVLERRGHTEAAVDLCRLAGRHLLP